MRKPKGGAKTEGILFLFDKRWSLATSSYNFCEYIKTGNTIANKTLSLAI
jgi:hypothetical protein